MNTSSILSWMKTGLLKVKLFFWHITVSKNMSLGDLIFLGICSALRTWEIYENVPVRFSLRDNMAEVNESCWLQRETELSLREER